MKLKLVNLGTGLKGKEKIKKVDSACVSSADMWERPPYLAGASSVLLHPILPSLDASKSSYRSLPSCVTYVDGEALLWFWRTIFLFFLFFSFFFPHLNFH
jgi:hypothetical protein